MLYVRSVVGAAARTLYIVAVVGSAVLKTFIRLYGGDVFMKYKVIIHEAEEGGYWAEVPSLPGCFSQGESLEEVKDNIKEAIEVYLESQEKDLRKLKKTDRVVSLEV